MKKYTLFYNNGKTQIVNGTNTQDAMNRSGINAAKAKTLVFYTSGDGRGLYVWSVKNKEWGANGN